MHLQFTLISLAIALSFFSSPSSAFPSHGRQYQGRRHVHRDNGLWTYESESVPSASSVANYAATVTSTVVTTATFTAGYATTTISTPTTLVSSATASSSVATSSAVPFGAASSSPTSSGTAASSEAFPSATSSISNETSTKVASNGFLRGVNVGGWLILEKWMNSDVFSGNSAVDQYTFDSTSGAAATLQNHWNTYFTQSDVQTLASAGINALRIPIGFWAYDNSNTPYIQGADEFLEKAIGWAQAAGMKVWVDCHGSPGSQNGFDNSGQQGNVDWQQSDNLNRSISVLQTMAQKYGAQQYAGTVVGLELVNEPISWGNNQLSTTEQFASDAYYAVKAAAANQNLMIVMHDAFEGPQTWTSFPSKLQSNGRFGVDTHMYQNQVASDNTLTQQQHIAEACGWASQLSQANAQIPTFVGEWSTGTNICVNPDGSTTAGNTCSVAGCQCQANADFSDWTDNMIEQVRRFTEAQMDVFEANTAGYFMWSAHGPGGWGFLNGIQNGAIPNPVTSRKYPGQCNSGSS
ncbi:MAG: exo-1,3-beta-glucanase [Pycnora praestabilis]|nr:MAG: exo-1,3-beta-glucanase [Pycnora praestabilis]